jgi:hypothetical protein
LQKSSAAAQKHDHPDLSQRKRAPVVSITPPSNYDFRVADKNQRRSILRPEKKTLLGDHQLLLGSEGSLQIAAKDSLEDLQKSPVCVTDESPIPATNEMTDAGGTRFCINSPKKLQKKVLTLKIDGADFELEKKKNKKKNKKNRGRPLSPFNNAGALRRIMSPSPPSAPAAVTEFGPTVAEKVEAQLVREKERRNPDMFLATSFGTTRAERDGKTLLGLLGSVLNSPSPSRRC